MNTASINVLIVEDDAVNLVIAEQMLRKAGYQVSTRHNGEQAIEAVKEQAFDVILMDIEMPLMDGLEATPSIRRTPNGQRIPIIALTAHTIPEKLEEIRRAGMDDYLIKPFDLQKFEGMMNKHAHNWDGE
ncbi:MAG: response regulator [Bacteroidota bacterium]